MTADSTTALTCPCCLAETPAEARDYGPSICPICFWEDDPGVEGRPREKSARNGISLFEARGTFSKLRAIKQEHADLVRDPAPSEMPRWPFRDPTSGALTGKRMTAKSDWDRFFVMTFAFADYEAGLIDLRALVGLLGVTYEGLSDGDAETWRFLAEPIYALDTLLGLMSADGRSEMSPEDRAYEETYVAKLRPVLKLDALER